MPRSTGKESRSDEKEPSSDEKKPCEALRGVECDSPCPALGTESMVVGTGGVVRGALEPKVSLTLISDACTVPSIVA